MERRLALHLLVFALLSAQGISQQRTDPDRLREALDLATGHATHGDHLVPGRELEDRPGHPLILHVPEASGPASRPVVWMLDDGDLRALDPLLARHGYAVLRLRRGSTPETVARYLAVFDGEPVLAGVTREQLENWEFLDWSAEDLRAAWSFVAARADSFGLDVRRTTVLASGSRCAGVLQAMAESPAAPAWSMLALVDPRLPLPVHDWKQGLPPLFLRSSVTAVQRESLFDFVTRWETAGGTVDLELRGGSLGMLRAEEPSAAMWVAELLRRTGVLEASPTEATLQAFEAFTRGSGDAGPRFVRAPGLPVQLPLGIRGVVVAAHERYLLIRLDEAPQGVPRGASLALIDSTGTRYRGEAMISGFVDGFAVARITTEVPGAQLGVGLAAWSDTH